MSEVVVLGLSCERPSVFGSGSVEVKPIFGEKKRSAKWESVNHNMWGSLHTSSYTKNMNKQQVAARGNQREQLLPGSLMISISHPKPL